MKYFVQFCRIAVGVLFIISGLIKLNDPLGFSFKLEEYFSPAVLDLPFLEPYALAIALFVVILEVILGVTLLLGYQIRLTLWTLLATILFFTFLTFYSAYFNKVTDCGCFGDAVKLTPWESFSKDVLLLVLILILIWGEKYINPLGSKFFRLGTTAMALLACIWFGNHVLNHLPVVDFRPYRLQASILEGMVIPEDAPKPVYEYDWKFNIDGTDKVITTLGEYPDVKGEFVGLEGTREIQSGYEPPIHDFTIEYNGQDLASSILQRRNLLLVVAYDLDKSEKEAFTAIKKHTDSALTLGYSVAGLSASSGEVTGSLKEAYGLDFPFYFTDMTALKTIVRSNPGLLRLKDGIIVQKLHFNDLDELNLPTLEESDRYPEDLKSTLDSIMVMDQKYRSDFSMENWGKQFEIDQQNMVLIDSILQVHGYPGKSLVGPETNKAAWYVIQHSERIDEFLPSIQIAAETGELPYRLYAMMLDRSLMGQGLPQKYGTQGRSYFMNTPEEINLIWPIENPEEVNNRRKAAGFNQSVEEYVADLFGEGTAYKVYTLEEVREIEAKQQ
ncbi:BT_3928 family protein [Robiginitalea aurantiaca]|uniref:DoxX family protein n=1 Tax=Robiginitalea aurantiaca TaxID=3056915 RepID=A0ABT7WDD3_9FLAO|nr:BT_3928 family protein [Robiginitalea aurantiaca]MDM9630931.1 DoxX family protein [Robiginitalea aurantiaca]